MSVTAAILAYFLVRAALLPGMTEPLSLALTLGALAAALVGSCVRCVRPEPFSERILLPVVLSVAVVSGLFSLGLGPVSVYEGHEGVAWPARLGLLLIGVMALSYAWPAMPYPAVRFVAVVVVSAALGTWLITHWPTPRIDVWHLQQEASAVLLRGQNPYAAEYTNPYADGRYFGDTVVKNGKIQSFPYPPLSLLLAVPGYLLGDVRWSLLAAILVTSELMVAAGRRLGLRAGHPAELAAIALLCHPRAWFVLEMGWTEAFVALGLAGWVWAAVANRQPLSALTLATVVSVKQYGLLLLPCLGTWQSLRWRTFPQAGLIAALVIVPFLLWNPAAFWQGVVRFHTDSPFREDSLTVPAAVFAVIGYQLPAACGFAAAGLVVFLVWLRASGQLSGAVLGTAAALLAFFLFNKAAHLNYYWLAETVLALTLILGAAQARRAPLDPPADIEPRLTLPRTRLMTIRP